MRRHLSRRLALLGATITLALGVPLGVALASHQFSDVPTSSPFHADIQALAAAGVTGGCAAGKFCPKGNVTREQMAAFLNRLGALAPGKKPVVNADKLDGLDGSAFYTKAQVNALLAGYVRRSDLGSQSGVLRWAHIRDLGATVEVYADDSSVGAPDMWVTRTGTGAYEVAVPGVKADGGYHSVFVTPEQGQTTIFRACKVFQNVSLGDPANTLVVRVRCYDQNAAASNTGFHILVFR